MRNRRLLLVAVVRFVVSPRIRPKKVLNLRSEAGCRAAPNSNLGRWALIYGANTAAAGRGGLCIGPDLLRSRRAALGAHLLPGQGYHTTRPQR